MFQCITRGCVVIGQDNEAPNCWGPTVPWVPDHFDPKRAPCWLVQPSLPNAHKFSIYCIYCIYLSSRSLFNHKTSTSKESTSHWAGGFEHSKHPKWWNKWVKKHVSETGQFTSCQSPQGEAYRSSLVLGLLRSTGCGVWVCLWYVLNTLSTVLNNKKHTNMFGWVCGFYSMSWYELACCFFVGCFEIRGWHGCS